MATLDISRLTPKKRLDLIGELWESFRCGRAVNPDARGQTYRRLATFDADRLEAIAWEDIEAKLDHRSR
ncbi:addiction module protein [Bradyrhizobium sp. 5.13L]